MSATPLLNPQQLAQFKLFGQGGANPLFDLPGAQQPPQNATPGPSPAPPQASTDPAQSALFGNSAAPSQPSPSAAPPSPGETARGSISSAMPSPAPSSPPSGNAPIAGAPVVPHHGTLAKILLGIGEAVGNPLATRIGERDRELQQSYNQYEANLPYTQAIANRAQQGWQSEQDQRAAQTREENAQADITGQNLPVQEQAQKLHDQLVQRWQSHVDPDENTFRQFAVDQLQSAPGRAGAMVAPHLDAITKLPQQQPQFKISGGTVEPLTYAGRSYGLQSTPGEPPEVTAARQSALGSLQQGELAKLDPIIRGQLGEPPINGKVTPAQAKLGIKDLASYMAKAEQIKTRMAAAPRLEMVMSKPVEVADQSGNVHYEKAGQAMSDGSMAPQSAQTKAQVKNLENFTSGGASTQLTAINTAREHMKTFSALADALDNNDTQALNKIGNAFGVQFGNDKATNFKIAAQAFGGEVGKAFDGAGVTEGERKSAQSAFNPNMSPQQFRGAIRTVDSLLAGKQKSLQSTYDAGRQGKPNFGSGETGRTQQAPAGATHIVPGPDGRNHYTNAQGTVDLGVAP